MVAMFGWFSEARVLRFALESREAIGVAREHLGQDLDRDVTIELRVARAIDLAHAAGAEGREDFVRAESCAGLQCHGSSCSFCRGESRFILPVPRSAKAVALQQPTLPASPPSRLPPSSLPAFQPSRLPAFPSCPTMNSMRRTLPLLLILVLAVPSDATRQPVRARHGMVVAMEAIAVDVGVSVLKAGGNAIDAAVAVGFAMAVTHPFAGNIGGGGYMLIRMADGRATFIDFRERAPQSRRTTCISTEGRADARQHRRVAIVGGAGHRSRIRDGGCPSTASGSGPRTWRPR